MHLLMPSYVADIPVAEDLLGLERHYKTLYPCHICYPSRELFFGCTPCPKRNAMATFKSKESLNISHKAQANKTLHRYSMISTPPVLSSFKWKEICSFVEVFSIFRLQPKYIFSLSISKMLEECLINMLKNYEWATPVLRTMQNRNKTQMNIRTKVCFFWIHFWERLSSAPAGTVLR